MELYCGADGPGRLVSRVDIPWAPLWPKPGTYSSEPPLSALSVSHGTMTPTFKGGTSYYTVPDVANAETRITITATPKEGYFVEFLEGSDSLVLSFLVTSGSISGLSADCGRSHTDYYGPLVKLTDPDTPGFQVDLYDDESYLWVHVYPTAVCSLGKGYRLTLTRAEGSVSSPRPNRPAVGLPVIAPPGRDPGPQDTYPYIASPCVGCTMNAYVSSIRDRDGWDESTFSYQWLADDAEITGATGSSYTVGDTDLSKPLKVRVSYTDDRGNEETLTSLATRVVRLRNFLPTGKPVILGTPEVGQTLRVDVSGISDPNGMTNATFTYQWVNTPWTDSDEYTLADSDEGRRIWLRAAYTDDAGHQHVLESASTDAVAARPSSPATGAPTISGTAQVGETLTADTSGIADENGLENVAFTYQWLADDADIAGATGLTYTLVAEDGGKAITVQVSFTDDAGNDETLTSAATDAVVSAALPPPPDNVRAVTQKSGAVDLTWEAPGDATVTGYRIDRRRAGGDRSDQQRSTGRPRDRHILVEDTGSTDTGYTDKGAEKGVEYEYRVSTRNEAGVGAGSDWVRAGPEPAPNNPATGAPAISGAVRVGETLKAETSGIADADGLSGATFSYQWLADDTDISGATNATYTLVADDKGKAISVSVSFTDDAGNEETLTSVATIAVVAAVPAPVDSGAPSYITVEVTEDYSDPINIVTNFAITWSDADVCSVDYNAYLNIKPTYLTGDETEGSRLHLGSAASDGAQITAGLTGVQGGIRGFDVELYCGTDGSGRLLSRVDIPWGPIRPKPGTYSSEPPLSALSVSHGTMTPTFQGGTSSYTVPDIANAETRITITATPKEGYHVKFFEGSDSFVLSFIVKNESPDAPSGLSDECDRSRSYSDFFGQLYERTDADPDTPGFQMDLYDGKNYVWVRVYPNAVCTLGEGYLLMITRAEGEISLPRPNTPASGALTISGRVQVWHTLTADTLQVRDRDGLTNATFNYQWLADDAEISGATGSSYTVAATDQGKSLKVQVSFIDDRGSNEIVTSESTRAVVPSNSSPSGVPRITGTTEVGQTLHADVSGIGDVNGLTNAVFEYQWMRNTERDSGNSSLIPGANDRTYTLVAADLGYYIKVGVSFTDDRGSRESMNSFDSEVVTAPSNSAPTGSPTISGTAQVGETLTADKSGIADADGLSNVQYEYQWLGSRDTEISGATGSTYTVAAADEGKTIKVRVSFTDDAGNNETLTSAATAAVAAAPTPNSPATGAPTISGTAQVGEVLEADMSGVADADGLGNVQYEYQWLADDSEIAGSTNATYTLADTDGGKAIKVEVGFTDDAGNAETLTSGATDVVAAAPVHAKSAPDLAVGTPSVDDASPFAGNQFTLSVTVTNAGDGASEPTWLRGYRSTDSTITTSDTEEGGQTVSALAAAGTSSFDHGLTAPSEAGTYYYGVCVDSVTGESDTTNNCSSSVQVTVSEPAPDLVVIGIDATDNIVTGGSFRIGVTVTNQGDAQSAATTLRWKQLVDGTTTEIGTADQRALTRPQGSFKTIRLTAPSTPSTSSYWACVDSVAGESDTTNNCSGRVTVTVTNNLATGAPTITGTAQVGQTLTADTSGIADADGLANATFSYQWLADDTDIAGANSLTYTLTDSEESKAITVQVSFTDDADNEETLTSAATDVVAGAQPTEPPAKPRGLEATTATHDSVTLTWDDPGDDSITGYVILRRIPGVDPEGQFDELVADTGTAATTYTDNTVAAETRYTYRIKAINGAGTSERSRWSHIDVPAAPVPDKPTGLEAAASHGQVVLTWDDPEDDSITGYVILRRVRVNDQGGDFSVLVANTESAATTYTDNEVAASTTYTYRIKAINEHGTSERSRWVHIDTPAAP